MDLALSAFAFFIAMIALQERYGEDWLHFAIVLLAALVLTAFNWRRHWKQNR